MSKNSVPTESFTTLDLLHAFGLRYASRIYCAANISAALMIPSLASMNIFQNGWYYFLFAYPAMTHVMGIGAYYVTPINPAKISLSSIAGRVFVSSLFAASIVLIGASVTGKIQIPYCSFFERVAQRISPLWVSSLVETVSTFAVQEISETSRQFLKFNAYSGLSYLACFVSLGCYLRAIPDFIRLRYQLLRASAIQIALSRQNTEQKNE